MAALVDAAISDAAELASPAARSMPQSAIGAALPMIDAMPAMPQAEARPSLIAMTAGHLRRCTFRRVMVVGATRVGRRSEPVYSVDCLYAGAEAPVALGDLAAARSSCDSCTYTGRFRADED